MSKLSELIAELCPKGVEYKKLGEICSYSRDRIDACHVTAKTYVGVENLKAEKGGKEDSSSVPSVGRLISYKTGDVLIGNIRPYLKKIWLADCEGGTNGDVLVIRITERDQIRADYLYHVLASDTFFAYDMQYAKGAKMPRGDKAAVMEYLIPLPPLEIQSEIVKILDNFAELTAELTAELQKRKKQYEHYRDMLLNFTGGGRYDNISQNEPCPSIEWKRLGEICEMKRGRVISKDYLRENEGIYPVYSSQTLNEGIFGYISSYDFDGEYLTWTTDGANAGAIFYHNGKFSITNVCGLLKPKYDAVAIKYLFYWLQKEARKHVSSGMGNPKLMSNTVASISIPLPPLAEQERIVAILDRFDSLCNSLTEGLPAEIALRKKQYEYYRDKLLGFSGELRVES